MIAPGLAVIFDMDGVLIDSNPVHREAWTMFNLGRGIVTTEEMHARMYGKRNDEIVRDFFGADLSEEEVFALGAEKEALYRKLMQPKLSRYLVPGVVRLLGDLKGAPVGLGTNAERANVDFLLDGAGLGQYFQVTVDGHQVARPKPAPDIYLRVAQLLDKAPENCIIFEDSMSGVAAAKAAGARVVGMATTHPHLEGVTLCLSDFEAPELRRWLCEQQPVV